MQEVKQKFSDSQELALIVAWRSKQSRMPVAVVEATLGPCPISRKAELERLKGAARKATRDLRLQQQDRAWRIDLEIDPHKSAYVVLKNPESKTLVPLYEVKMDRGERMASLVRLKDLSPYAVVGMRAQDLFAQAFDFERSHYHSSIVLEMLRHHIDKYDVIPFRYWGGAYLVPPRRRLDFITFARAVEDRLPVEFVVGNFLDSPENRQLVAHSVSHYVKHLLKEWEKKKDSPRIDQEALRQQIVGELERLKKDFAIAERMIDLKLRGLGRNFEQREIER